MSSYRVKLRRGTTAETSVFTGEVGEVTVDTTKKTLVVHDGATRGGHPLPRDTDVKTDLNQLTDNYGLLQSYVDGFTGSTEVYAITVAPDSSGNNNVFYITGLENPHIVLTPGNRYVFDVSDSSNTGHPLYFTADDGVTNYTTNVSRIGTEGTAGAKVIFIIPADVPALKYYCSVHGLSMGNQISSVLNTPSSGGGSSSLASFDISPALPTGETSWNLATDGDLSITEAGNWTFTATTDGTVDLSMKGAGGGYGKDTNALGGTGGLTSGKISVSAGDVFKVTVGSKGVQSGGAGAYGGGGAGGNLTLPGSGGGYSGIFEGNEQQSKSILIAGGGGGGHGWDVGSATGNGGSGGGSDGLAGTAGSSGSGATQISGGAGAGNGTSGTPLTGGTGGNRSTNQGSGGGGGGGYFGGGGGAAGTYNGNQNGTPGGGGSGYIGGTSNFAVTDGVTTAGSGSTTEVDGTFSMVGQVATTEETPTVTTPTVISDSYETIFHLTTDGAAGVNTEFADSSSTAATVTAGGSSVQLSTFSPYRHGGYSTHFDGTGDYLSMPSAEGFKFGTGDFTIEGWVNFNISNTTKWHTPIDCWQSTNNYNWLLNLKADTFAVALGNNGAYSASHTHQVTISPALSAGNWYHFAVTRESGSLRHFINGIQQGITISSGANISDNIPVAIGINQDGGQNGLDGHLSDIRIVKGTALYTADFTPPTERLTAIDGTELLTCHLPYIVDGSTNSHAITLNGNVHTKPTSPYDRVGYSEDLHGGSVYFDGTDGTNASEGYLSLANSTNFGFGTDDFTIEAWVYFIERPPTSNGYRFIFSTMDLSDTIGVNFGTDTSGEITFTINQSGASDFTANSTGVRPEANQWMHLALVKNSGTVKIYQNGQQIGSDKSSTADTGSSRAAVIGAVYTNRNLYGPKAYISDLRVVKGTAVYTADFTPPTTPLESTNAALHIKGVEGHIIDKAQSDHRLTLVGNTVASIAESKYAGSSMYFDGSGDYLTIPTTAGLSMGTGDFTVESWFNTLNSTYSTNGSSQTLFAIREQTGGAPVAGVIRIFISGSSGKLGLALAGVVTTSSTVINANQWYHIAVVRSGTQVDVYLDGVSVINVTEGANLVSLQPTLIGAAEEGDRGSWDGYIEDFRITKGIARYTEDFTPPTESLDLYTETGGTTEETTGPTVTTYNLLNDSSKTGLLITTDGEAGVNSSFTDSSSNAATVTAGNTPQLNTFSPYRHGGYSTYFDGAGDYITIPNNSGTPFDFGTGNFTIEGWFYLTTSGSWTSYWGISQGGGPAQKINLYDSAGDGTLDIDVDGSVVFSSSAVLTDLQNKWAHIALVREGTGTNQTKLYVNGSVVGQGTVSTNFSGFTQPFTIGHNGEIYSGAFNGYISDFRIVSSAVYTADFTPPTERLTAIAGTELLTCHLPYIFDESTNNNTITINGNTKTEPFSPYDHTGYIEGTHGGSVYFDGGTNDYLKVGRLFDGATVNTFTIECWINYSNATSYNYNGHDIPGLFSDSMNISTGESSGPMFGTNPSDQLVLYWWSGSPNTCTSTETIDKNTWTHIAAVCDNNSIQFYINGVAATMNGTTTWSGTSQTLPDCHIGGNYHGNVTGYISDFRVTSTAVYTADFTPPTAPLESTGTELHIKGSEGHIIDKSQSGNNFTLVGDVTASTAESKYAGSSISLDGNGDHIQLENTPDIDVSTGDFTWEGWFNWNDISNNPKMFTSLASSTTYWQLYVYSSKLTLRVNGSQTVYGVDTTNISTNQWYHIALVRSGDTFTVYKDGVSVITDTYAGSIGHYSDNGIGGLNSYPASSMNGYMEDVRLSKFARYTENFTVPDAALESPQTTGGGAYIVATGGTITTDGNYKYHTFTGDGTFSVTGLGTNNTIDVLAVGGGGGGGGSSDSNSGGGGAGGYLEGSITAEVQSYDIVIGQGGTGGVADVGTSGGDTTISVLNATALGGGYGGGGARSLQKAAAQGGSGGGGGGFPNDMSGGAGIQGDSGGLTGYGNAGGSIGSYSSDGGGGAGQAGGTNANSAGGDGRQWLDGNYYAGGGSGGAGNLAGGLGGGGAGSNGSGNGANATANTGGGGGGSYASGSSSSSTGGNGGSGVVIFRYPYQGAATETAIGSATFSDLLAVTSHPINVYDDTREQRETTNAFSGTHSLYINNVGSTRRSPQDTSSYTYSEYTISFWARMESWNTYNGTRINWLTNGPKYDGGNSHGDGAIYVVDNSNEVGFVAQRYNGSIYHYVSGTASSSFATDAWYHFVVTGDATNNTATLTVSSDGGTFGDMIDTSTFTTGNQVATLTPQNLYLAGSSSNAANGTHQIRYDLYGIWDRVLDATERQAVFDAGATHDHPNLPTTGLKLYYTFDDDYNNYSNTPTAPAPGPTVLTPNVVQNNVNYSNPGVAYVNNLATPDQKLLYSIPVSTWNSWDKVEIVFDAQVWNQDSFPSLFDLTGGNTTTMRSYIRANRNGVYAGGVSGTYSSDSTGWVSNWTEWNTFTITVDMSQSTDNSTISVNDVVKLTGTAPQTWTGAGGTSDIYISFFQMAETSNSDNGIVAYIDNIYIKGYINDVLTDQFYEDFS